MLSLIINEPIAIRLIIIPGVGRDSYWEIRNVTQSEPFLIWGFRVRARSHKVISIPSIKIPPGLLL